MKSFYLLIAHGSRQNQANRELFKLVEKFRKAYPKRRIEGCFLEIASPSIPVGIQICIDKGAEEIFVIPLMVFTGRHVQEHIPSYIREARIQHPELDFHFGTPLADHPLLLKILEDKTKAKALKRKK